MFCKKFTCFKKDETFSGELVLKIIFLLWIFVVSFNLTLLYLNELINFKRESCD